MVASLRAFSLEKGPPGMACIRKNVMAQMMKIVRIASSTRFAMYLPIYLTSFMNMQVKSRCLLY